MTHEEIQTDNGENELKRHYPLDTRIRLRAESFQREAAFSGNQHSTPGATCA